MSILNGLIAVFDAGSSAMAAGEVGLSTLGSLLVRALDLSEVDGSVCRRRC